MKHNIIIWSESPKTSQKGNNKPRKQFSFIDLMSWKILILWSGKSSKFAVIIERVHRNTALKIFGISFEIFSWKSIKDKKSENHKIETNHTEYILDPTK